MMLGPLLLLRIAQTICSLVVLALSSYVAQWYDRETLTPSPSQFNYLIYVSLASCFSVAYLHFVPIQWPRFTSLYTSFLVEACNFVFILGGFIALAIFLHDLKFCRGNVCTAARTDATFAAFSCLVWLSTTFLMGRQVLRQWLPSARRGRYAPPAEMTGV